MGLCADNAVFPNSTFGLAAAETCVGQAYEVLLFRPADDAGMAYWSNWLVTTGDPCYSLYVSMILAAPSTTYPNTPNGLISAGYLIGYVYATVLNRAPAASETEYWAGQAVTKGWTFSQLRSTIIASAQTELHPPPAPVPVGSTPTPAPAPTPVGSTPAPAPQQPNLPPASQSQIESWYQLYVCHAADPAGLAFWMAQPDAGHTQAAIAASCEAQAVAARGGCNAAPVGTTPTGSGSSTPLVIAGVGIAAVLGIILVTKPAVVRPDATRVTAAA